MRKEGGCWSVWEGRGEGGELVSEVGVIVGGGEGSSGGGCV